MQQKPLLNDTEARHYLEGLGLSRLKLGLSRIEALLNQWGNPQDRVPCIHVAGTNGKGSVVAMLTAILKVAGYTVGSTVSPHLMDLKERIQRNGEPISSETLQELVSHLQETIEIGPQNDHPPYFERPTYFESMVAFAFLYFHQVGCDIAVIETGLGGRLDATNILKNPVLSIITSISLDHTEILGETLAEIATEKAGIIKPGCPVVLGPNLPESAEHVFLKQARAQQADITQADASDLIHIGLTTDGYALWKNTRSETHYKLALLGLYQGENLATVLASVNQLRQKGYTITEEALQEGLQQTHWPGRFQYFQDQQLIIDGSHNEAGFKTLSESLLVYFNGQPLRLIFSLRQNRDPNMLVKLLDRLHTNHPIQAICCINGEPENLYHPPEKLSKTLQEAFPRISITASTLEATCRSNQSAKEALTILTGSLYTAGSVLKHIQYSRLQTI